MMKRIYALPLMILALAACQKQDEAGQAQDAGQPVECALAGSAEYKGDCRLEYASSGGGLLLVVHHPDGGFRRFVPTGDERGIAAADGADVADVQAAGNLFEVAIGGDRYRIPALPRDDAAKP